MLNVKQDKCENFPLFGVTQPGIKPKCIFVADALSAQPRSVISFDLLMCFLDHKTSGTIQPICAIKRTGC